MEAHTKPTHRGGAAGGSLPAELVAIEHDRWLTLPSQEDGDAPAKVKLVTRLCNDVEALAHLTSAPWAPYQSVHCRRIRVVRNGTGDAAKYRYGSIF